MTGDLAICGAIWVAADLRESWGASAPEAGRYARDLTMVGDDGQRRAYRRLDAPWLAWLSLRLDRHPGHRQPTAAPALAAAQQRWAPILAWAQARWPTLDLATERAAIQAGGYQPPIPIPPIAGAA